MIRLLKVKVFKTITSLSFHQHDKHANSLAREGASAQSGPIPYAGHMSILLLLGFLFPTPVQFYYSRYITLCNQLSVPDTESHESRRETVSHKIEL